MAPPAGFVLLLNHNADECEAYRTALKGAGYGVVVCADPFDVFVAAKSSQPIALITRGVHPGVNVDAVELTRRLKRDRALSSIHIIVTASLREAHLRRDAFNAGCDEFLLLPATPDDVVNALRRVLSSGRSRRPA